MDSLINEESLHDICRKQIHSKYIFEKVRKYNIEFSTLIIIIGLIGNSLAVFVFSHKKFRKNSSSVYFLCLAISDGLFLLTHFFEDTLRTYIDMYFNQNIQVHDMCRNHTDVLKNNLSAIYVTYLSPQAQSFIRLLNITDKFNIFCILINYFRYFLRFISAYIIVAFTVHNTLSIYSPCLNSRSFSKRVAWTTVNIITLCALAINIWVCNMPLIWSFFQSLTIR